MKRTTIFLAFVALLLLAGSTLAMDSAPYQLDWFTPLIGDGGGPATSTTHGVTFTAGQSAVGTSSSTNYGGCLGYWCGEFEYRIFLPLVLRNYSPP